MPRANLNKSVWLVTNTTTASKFIPKRTRICLNWNPPFQTQNYLIKVSINVKIVKQDLLHKKQFLKILWSEVWKGGFQLIQILGLMGMYFDAVVVEVKTFLLLFRLALAILSESGAMPTPTKSWNPTLCLAPRYFRPLNKSSRETLPALNFQTLLAARHFRHWTSHCPTGSLDRKVIFRCCFHRLTASPL